MERCSNNIEPFTCPEIIYQCKCEWCSAAEQYDCLFSAKRDGWCVGYDSRGNVGLWCGACDPDEPEEEVEDE